jgi:NAD(P)-dependent dehydrogenase (short-subunit alcohol dehydrogenase family)
MTKTVLITGASSGIGAATAKYFLDKGWNVSATMRSPNHAENWTKVERVTCPQLDVTLPETIKMAVRETVEHFGRIDVLINNAGYALVGPLEGVTPEQLERQFQTNVFGLVYTIQAILPVLRQQGGGTIVNIASMGGRLAFPLYSSYHGTKWAVEGISESLRYELRRFNIQVKIIEPGAIKTNFIDSSATWTNHPKYTDLVDGVKHFTEKLNNSLPEPEGVAKTIYKAASDRSGRLRYSPYGEPLLFLHALLPDFLWRLFIQKVMLGKTP